MINKKVNYKQIFSLLLACLSFLLLGTCALFENGGINYVSLAASTMKVLPSVAIMFAIGWLMGYMIDSSKVIKTASQNYTESLIDEILREEGIDDLANLTPPDIENNDVSIKPESIEP